MPKKPAEAIEAEDIESVEPEVVAVESAPLPDGHVTVRVLPRGDGRVATGEFDGSKFTHFKRGDMFVVHESIAKRLEDDGFGEIVS